ncbi:MAG: hypothetical protein JOZ74_15380 [Bradyrhizobium sp.]|nr:hypothetical protein [Bradyrhizobium sp.]
MPESVRSFSSGANSKVFLTCDPSSTISPNVWAEAGQAIAWAHRPTSRIGFVAWALIALTLTLAVRFGWAGLS